MIFPRRLNSLFPQKLGFPVHIQGPGRSLFGAGNWGYSVEHIVCAEMDQSGPCSRTSLGYMAGSLGIDPKGSLLFRFATVHIGDGCKVDDHLRSKGANGLMGLLGSGNIQVGKVFPDDLVPKPLWASTRAFTIEAPPEEVWPWVVQMGFPPHRAGWYTPHWLDAAMWGDRPRHVFPPIRSSDFSWVFVLLPTPEGGTRFVVRARVGYSPVWTLPIVDGAIGLGDLFNVSVMLRSIRTGVLAAR